MLFCVMGGKLSEGINFSDDMARCVVIVGLPYPNPNDVELSLHMQFMEEKEEGSGRRMYENLCMRSVNQAIGRSIRHRGDFACVVLLDERYSKEAIASQLSSWLQPFVRRRLDWHQTIDNIDSFFQSIEEGVCV